MLDGLMNTCAPLDLNDHVMFRLWQHPPEVDVTVKFKVDGFCEDRQVSKVWKFTKTTWVW